jgi:alanine dehydrogenase
MAEKGIMGALCEDPALAKGVNVHKGEITYEAVASAFEMNYTPFENPS